MYAIIRRLRQKKYELLLFALLAHLLSGAFFSDTGLYIRVAWPISVLLVAYAGYNVFSVRGALTKAIKYALLLCIAALPFLQQIFPHLLDSMELWSALYALFFCFLFIEVIRYLIRPSYIDFDVISAAACGFLTLIEVGVFIHMVIYYAVPDAYRNIAEVSALSPLDAMARIYLDMAYFNTISLTTVGYGDITPIKHQPRLLSALMGVMGQFYLIMLVGIIISKYVSAEERKKRL